MFEKSLEVNIARGNSRGKRFFLYMKCQTIFRSANGYFLPYQVLTCQKKWPSVHLELFEWANEIQNNGNWRLQPREHTLRYHVYINAQSAKISYDFLLLYHHKSHFSPRFTSATLSIKAFEMVTRKCLKKYIFDGMFFWWNMPERIQNPILWQWGFR